MRLFALLSLLPVLTLSTPVPITEAEAVAEPYNPFSPPPYPVDADVPHYRRFTQEELLDRAQLEESGRDQIALAMKAAHGPVKRSAEITDSTRGQKTAKVCTPKTTDRKVRKRAKVCTPKTKTASATSAVVTQTGNSPSSSTSQSNNEPSTAGGIVAPTTTRAPVSTPTAVRKSVDPYGDGPFSGWGTWFEVGLSACGTWDTPGMPVVAVSAELFDQWPGYNGWNPNVNPICGKHLDITWGGKTLTVEVTDRCPSCSVRSLDLSKGAFQYFADLDVGLFGGDNYTPNITWSWTTGSGRLTQLPV